MLLSNGSVEFLEAVIKFGIWGQIYADHSWLWFSFIFLYIYAYAESHMALAYCVRLLSFL